MIKMNRRGFLKGIAPLCAAPCLGAPCLQAAVALAQTEENSGKDDANLHKFDKPFPQELTIRQFFEAEYRYYIPMVKAMKKEFGDERVIELIKSRTEEQMLDQGKRQAERNGDNSFRNFTGYLKTLDFLLTMEVVEDTDTVFEIKVPECVIAETFLKHDAGDIGFASVCFGDYAWPRGYNRKMKMVRDKTLMQGHGYCNHRYVLEG